MPPEPSGSFPSSIEDEPLVAAPGVTAGVPVLRLLLTAWAVLVYAVYWLGYLR